MRKKAIGILSVIVVIALVYFTQKRTPSRPTEIETLSEPSENSITAIMPAERATKTSQDDLKTAPPPPLPPVITMNDVLSMAQKDRLCISEEHNIALTDAYKFNNEEQRKHLLLKSLATANKKPVDPCIMALLTREKTHALRWAQKNNSNVCKFIRALVYTDQMQLLTSENGPAASPSHLLRGLNLLDELQSSDRNNGIYSFFKVSPLMALGQQAEAETAILQFFRAHSFDSPLRSLEISIRELGRPNGTSLVLAVEIYSAVDGPEFAKASTLIKDWLAANRSEDTVMWAERWLATLDRLISAKASEPFVSTIETAALKGISRTIAQNDAPHLLENPIFDQEQWEKVFNQLTRVGGEMSWEPQDTCHNLHRTATHNHPHFFKNLRDQQRRISAYQ